jgi:hypothetical protein
MATIVDEEEREWGAEEVSWVVWRWFGEAIWTSVAVASDGRQTSIWTSWLVHGPAELAIDRR